jgi:alginate O-acetyltransferase complex protein AlgF
MFIPSRLAVAVALTALAGNAAAEGAFAQLYAARPPAGSSFVRIVNPDATPLRVQIANGPAQEPGAAKPATTYAIVKGNQPFTVQVDGKPAATLQVAPDTFSTLIPKRDGGTLTFAVIDDSNGAQDALKAELRFYNLAADCAAGQLSVSPSGPVLFQDVKPGAAAAAPVLRGQVSATDPYSR